MPDRELEQFEQIVFFVDVLGSSAVVLGSDSQRTESLTKMLRDVGSARRDFDITRVERKPPLLKEDIISVMPAVSTFSDNVLMSFKVDEMLAQKVSDPFREAF